MKVNQLLQLQEIQKLYKIPIGLMLSPCKYQGYLQQLWIKNQKSTTSDTKKDTHPEIPKLEDDSEQDQFADAQYLDQHNTHKDSERIRREYSARPQHLSNDKYYAQVNNSRPQLTPSDNDSHHLLQKNYDNYMAGAGEEQEGKSYTAIDLLALKITPWKAESSRK